MNYIFEAIYVTLLIIADIYTLETAWNNIQTDKLLYYNQSKDLLFKLLYYNLSKDALLKLLYYNLSKDLLFKFLYYNLSKDLLFKLLYYNQQCIFT
jgi:hypothetical protein